MKWWFWVIVPIVLFGCQKNIDSESQNNANGSPNNSDSIYSQTDAITLGEKLFFDSRLSKNGNISCASCHIPQYAFSDTVSLSRGTDGELGFRNASSIVNVGSKELFHKDGGVRTLELQVLAPIIDSTEMEGDFLKILDFLSEDPEYSTLFQAAFHTPPTVFGITRAIAAYEKSLNFLNSPYDKYIQGDSLALTEAEIRGMDLFFSEKLNCTSCHSGNLFTDYSYRNIGIEHQFQDSGRARITLLPEDAGKFEVPSLRNVGVTAPYMHDGSFETLEEVVRYLEIGGGTHPNKSALVQPFSLSDAERKDLVAFLNALTDEAFQN